MSFNPIETSLYVTFSTLTQDHAALHSMSTKPYPSTRKHAHNFFCNDDFMKQEILAFTAPPSPLEPYQQIIYKFSKRLERDFMSGDVMATDMLHDGLAIQHTSSTIIGLKKEQIRFLYYIDQFLDYCNKTPIHDATSQTRIWRNKIPLIRDIFKEAQSSITGDEYSELLDMARTADTLKDRFTRVNSLYLPK